MTAVLDRLALAVTAAGLVAALLVLLRTGRPPAALAALLDMLTAAGLLRLTGSPDAKRLLTAATIIALRRVVRYGIDLGGRPEGAVARPGEPL